MEKAKNIEKEGGAQEGIAPFISWSKDSQGNYTSCNEKFEEFFGVKESDIIGKNNSDFMEGALSALFDELDRAVLKSQKQLSREEQTLALSGEHVIFEIIKTPLFDSEKKPSGIFSIMRDVTELKRIKKEAEEKEKYSQSLLRISRKMEQAQTYQEVLLAAKEDVASVLGYKNMWVYLFDEDKEYARSIVATGEKSDFVMSEEGSAILKIKGDRMLEEVASAKEIIIVPDARTDERTDKYFVNRMGNRTIVGVPIILFDKHLGTVGVGTFGDEGIRVPTLAEQKYLIAIASHMAVSLDRIRLLLERKKTDTKVERLSSLYATLSACNNAIVHSETKEELFQKICDTAVVHGGFKMVWIGLIDKETKQIIPIASHGDTNGFLETTKIYVATGLSKEDGENCSTSVAAQTLKPIWCQDFDNVVCSPLLLEKGTQSGWASAAALPLFERGPIVGVLTLYSGEKNVFDDQIQELLEEMASDISYALGIFIEKKEKKIADKAIKKLSEDLLLANKNLQKEKTSIEKAKAQDEAIMASLGEGMIAINKKGEIVAMNRTAEKITGLRTSEAIGSLITKLVHAVDFEGKDIPDEERPILRVIATGKSFEGEINLVGKEGRITPVSVVVSPIVVNNELVGAASIFRDITKEKEIETTRRDILSLASHQLRTPLSGTKWLIETLQRGVQGELTKGQKEYLDELHKVNERMTTLVQDMLKALRVETDPFLSGISECSVKKVFENTIETLKLAAEKRQITMHAPKYDDYVIETNSTVLENILHVFVSNGIDYSPPGTDVYMEVEDKDNELVFMVRDSGIGIPEDERARIFERFYRASNAKIFDTTGSGLGLYTANVLAKKIGARISFDSEEGKGSTFYLYVPSKSPNSNSIKKQQ